MTNGSADNGRSDSVDSLLRSIDDGDSAAMETLLRKYRPYLRVVAQKAMRAMFAKKFDASDAVQQTCMEAFNAIGSFRGKTEAEFNGWITTILQRNMYNLMRDHTAQKRDVRREFPIDQADSEATLMWHAPVDGASGPESRVIRGEAALALAEAFGNLTEPQQTAVQMRFFERLKLTEIAAYMEISPPSVARLIERGINALRKHLPAEMKDVG